MSNNIILANGTTHDKVEIISSLELLNQINFFRNQIEGKKELAHRTLLTIIRDEFEEEIREQKLLQSSYTNSQGKSNLMFNLTISQAKQVLVRESKAVRRAVIKKLEKFEQDASQHLTYLQQRVLQLEAEKQDLFPSSTSLSERLLRLLRKSSLYKEEADQIRQELETQRRISCNCYKTNDNYLRLNDILDRLKIRPHYKKVVVETLRDYKYTIAGQIVINIDCMFVTRDYNWID